MVVYAHSYRSTVIFQPKILSFIYLHHNKLVLTNSSSQCMVWFSVQQALFSSHFVLHMFLGLCCHAHLFWFPSCLHPWLVIFLLPACAHVLCVKFLHSLSCTCGLPSITMHYTGEDCGGSQAH